MDIIINPKHFNHYINKEKVNLNSKLYPVGFENQYDKIVGFVKDWILSVTGEDFFKNIYINESISYKRIKRKTQMELLKYDNPQIAIIPRIDYNFNRDNVDLYQRGINTLQLSRIDESIIKDYDNKSFIGMKPRQIKIDFDIKIKVSTKIQQLKIYELLKLALKCGSTQDIYTQSSFQIPYELIEEVYSELFNKKIDITSVKDTQNLVDYINSNSITPVIYELDKSNGSYNFYITVDNYNHHIVFLDQISIDDGEKEGHIYNNFMIDFNFSVYGACPHFYYWFFSDKSKINNYYYSYENDKIYSDNDKVKSESIISESVIPDRYNNQNIYVSVKITEVNKGDFTISISDIKSGLGFANNVIKSINYCISRCINPSSFITFLAMFKGQILDIEELWFENKIIIKNVPENCVLDFAVYVDSLYINKILSDIELNNTQ